MSLVTTGLSQGFWRHLHLVHLAENTHCMNAIYSSVMGLSLSFMYHSRNKLRALETATIQSNITLYPLVPFEREQYVSTHPNQMEENTLKMMKYAVKSKGKQILI